MMLGYKKLLKLKAEEEKRHRELENEFTAWMIIFLFILGLAFVAAANWVIE